MLSSIVATLGIAFFTRISSWPYSYLSVYATKAISALYLCQSLVGDICKLVERHADIPSLWSHVIVKLSYKMLAETKFSRKGQILLCTAGGRISTNLMLVSWNCSRRLSAKECMAAFVAE